MLGAISTRWDLLLFRIQIARRTFEKLVYGALSKKPRGHVRQHPTAKTNTRTVPQFLLLFPKSDELTLRF